VKPLRGRRELEQVLADRYYGPSTEMSADASSHWITYGAKSHVVMKSEGLRLSGEGFGSVVSHGLVHDWFDWLTRAAHRWRLPDLPDLHGCWEEASRLAVAAGLRPTFDVFRQACTAAFLAPHLSLRLPERILLIGDGYGLLGALLKRRYSGAQIVFVDLGRTLIFQVHHVGRALPGMTQALLESSRDWPSTDFVYCGSEAKELLKGAGFDAAVNVASMQEMTPETVSDYFGLLRVILKADNFFYCCNRERKSMPGGEVSEFHKYPWMQSDRVHVDEPCPWHQFYLSPLAIDMTGAVPVPFVRRYDGVHLHRLVTMATEPHP